MLVKSTVTLPALAVSVSVSNISWSPWGASLTVLAEFAAGCSFAAGSFFAGGAAPDWVPVLLSSSPQAATGRLVATSKHNPASRRE